MLSFSKLENDDSYLSYCCLGLVWAQNFSSIQRILILRKKSVRNINVQPMTKEFPYQSPIQAKFHLKILRENLPRKYFVCQQIFK